MSAGWIRAAEDLKRLLDGRIPEGPSLEYKQALVLVKGKQRVETLKDLTGMANGGGGTIIFGVREAQDGGGIPEGIAPLRDGGIIGRLEDIVRSGVHPPLAMDLRTLECGDGFVLIVDVFPSGIGPYMVEAYDEHRYFIRQGTRTVPMTERQVRDAYALAQSLREAREQRWREHALPLEPPPGTEEAWLSVSALPVGHPAEVLDLSSARRGELRPPAEWGQILPRVGRFDESTSDLRIWRDGVFGEESSERPRQVFRLYRDGAACLGALLWSKEGLNRFSVFRALNAQLAYLAWLWDGLDLRVPVEVDVTLWNVTGLTLAPDGLGAVWIQDLTVGRPVGVPEEALSRVGVRREVLPAQLRRASVRHRVVRDFADRLHQAFGLPRAGAMFRYGWLYGPGGSFLGLSVTEGELRDVEGRRIGALDQEGVVRRDRDREVLGFVVDGVFLDEGGLAMAALEMATGSGLPDDFLVSELSRSPVPPISVGLHGPPEPSSGAAVPKPVGRWSARSLSDVGPGRGR